MGVWANRCTCPEFRFAQHRHESFGRASVKPSIGTDVHTPTRFDFLRPGVLTAYCGRATARRLADLTRPDVPSRDVVMPTEKEEEENRCE